MIFSGLRWLANEILKQVDEERYDVDRVHGEMSDAYAAMESGAISEEEFERREARLVEKLEEIEARRREAEGAEDEDEDEGEGDAEDDDGADAEDEDEGDDAEDHDGAGDGDAAVHDQVQANRRAP